MWDVVVTLQLGVGMFLLSLFIMDSSLVIWYRLLECLRGEVWWSFPGGFCRYSITELVRLY